MSRERRYAPTIFAVAATINSLPSGQGEKIFKHLGGHRAVCQALLAAGNRLQLYETETEANDEGRE